MIESIDIMYVAVHANNTMHKNIPFPQIKLRLIHTRYLVSDLFFVEDCPFVEDFPSEYFHSKDSSWPGLAFARVSEVVEVVGTVWIEE